MLLKNKVAIVTGANRGIGKAIVEVFAREGCNVYACMREEKQETVQWLEKLAQENDVFATPIYFDITNSEAMKQAVVSMCKQSDIDILVNNAGMVGENRLFQMTSIAQMKRVFDVNFFAAIELTQLISRKMMRRQSGSIINIASVAGIDGDPAQMEYSASKAAIICATKKLAIELGKFNIRVNAVAPGITDTDMLNTMAQETEEAEKNKSIMGRRADPFEIANAVAFLASDRASYITAQTIRVDGGII